VIRRVNLPIACVLTLSAILLFVNLGSARLWDRDEPRNAGCAAEMMQRGDWIVPTFNGELRSQKPVLLYWLIGSAYAVFGVNEFAARFWSALLSLGTVGLTYLIGKRLLGSQSATIGALALATSVMFLVAGRAATPDAALIFCQTLALTFFVYATFAPRHQAAEPLKLRHEGEYFPKSIRRTIPIYAAMGLGVLAKGPIGFLMPSAIIGMFLLIETLPVVRPDQLEPHGYWTRGLIRLGRLFGPRHLLKCVLLMNPLLAVPVIAAVAAPWFVAVAKRTDGVFLERFFMTENLGRAVTTFENHGGGLWFYPVAIALGFFPWSFFLVPMFLGLDRRLSRQHPAAMGLTLLACWIGVQVGIFSLFSTKLPSYVTPCYPALALCCGFILERWSSELSRLGAWGDKLLLATIALAGIALAIGFRIAGSRYLDGSTWLMYLGLLWVAVAFLGWRFVRSNRIDRWITAFQGAAVIFGLGVFGFATLSVDRMQQADRLLEPIQSRGTPVAAYRCLEPSWVFYLGRPIHELATDSTGAPEPLGGPIRFWHPRRRILPAQFVSEHPDACFITTEHAWPELQAQLPSGYEIVETVPYFLREKKLVLVATRSARFADRDAVDHSSK
jgi:4-amino-4-deoxy-L-arabinose transferase-like glycosyltransferase